MLKKYVRSALNNMLRFTMPRGRFGINLMHFLDTSYFKLGVGFPYRGYEAVQCLLKNYDFSTVLDVGCGSGVHSDIFLKAGKKVTAVDRYSSFFEGAKDNPDFSGIKADFMSYDFGGRKFDCVWCSHVLEHQHNTQTFLTKLVGLVNTTYPGGGGVLAVTVPPYDPMIVPGHVSLWNAGLLLFRLVQVGVDCRNARVKTYDYDVSVIVSVNELIDTKTIYAGGDLRGIFRYLPSGLQVFDTDFYGNISELNWN